MNEEWPTLKGSCLCGAIRFRIKGPYTEREVCHCSLCRKGSGGGFTTTIATYADNLEWLQKDVEISSYQHSEIYSPNFCSRCGSPVPLVGKGGACFIFHRSPGCQGIWFDMLEKEDLLAISGSETIDTGDPETGEKYNDVTDVNCPHCQVPMINMIDKDQHHIQFECCPTCYGTFFDAGEFADLKDHTLAERLGQLWHTVKANLDR